MDVLNHVVSLPVKNIQTNPGQPRRNFPEDTLKDLAQSIEQNGLLQPISVREISEGVYELIAGERRLRAYELLGRKEIPALVESMNDVSSHMLALIENLQRETLSFFDQAQAIQSMMDLFEINQTDMARRLGMAQSTVANKLRLLRLDNETRRIVEECGFTERHARCLLLLEDDGQRALAAREIARRGMNVAQAERYIEDFADGQKPKQTRLFVPKDVRIFINTINKAIDTMKSAGIPARTEREEDEDFIRYTVCIPKKAASRPHRIPNA